MNEEEMINVLKSWEKLNEKISEIGENDLKLMLNYEVMGKGRRNVVERLHQRYCKLRTNRERELLTLGGML